MKVEWTYVVLQQIAYESFFCSDLGRYTMRGNRVLFAFGYQFDMATSYQEVEKANHA